MSKPFLHVVAGLIIEDGKVFIAQRKADDSNPGRWEFPGGKVEDGEDPQAALKRELAEELGAEVEVLRLFGSNTFETDRAIFRLDLYRCVRRPGPLYMHEHSDHAWVFPQDLTKYNLLSGDLPFVEKILKIRL